MTFPEFTRIPSLIAAPEQSSFSQDTNLSALRADVTRITREAAAIALAAFRPGSATSAKVHHKQGGSPVSDADYAVDAFLVEALMRLLPQAGWLSEETADDRSRLDRALCWVVDPIDGTRAFITGNPDWCLSIALVAEGRPILGIVHAPARNLVYEAAAGEGAYRNGAPIATAERDQLRGARVAGPKPLLDLLEARPGSLVRLPRVPSLALRLARVADGEIDATAVSANAWDWDIAAADLIIHEAGGRLTTLDATRPLYNLRDPEHDILFASCGGLHDQGLALLERA